LQTRNYEKNGEKRYVTEVVLGAFKAQLLMLDRSERTSSDQEDYGTAAKPARRGELDDEVPF
jgi:single-stranded DNA-binding protein